MALTFFYLKGGVGGHKDLSKIVLANVLMQKDNKEAGKGDVILSVEDHIRIKGARANNLKNVDLVIPKDQLIVVTGVSGSGKSSLTMDTLYAEGQRRYVESLSSYARQFLMRMKKPDVDTIEGICPAIAIEQKVSTSNARSTVGSLTEIYDYLRLLYARIGHTYSPVSGEEVRRHEVSDVTDFIHGFEEGTKVQLFIPLPKRYQDRTVRQQLNLLLQKGYTRILFQEGLMHIEDAVGEESPLRLSHRLHEVEEPIEILIDRFVVKQEDEENQKRIADSVQTSFYESEGEVIVYVDQKPPESFNNRFELDGLTFLEPTPQLFNYNNSYGACPRCEGYGRIMGIDERKVVPDPTLSVYEGAIACWKGEKLGRWLDRFLDAAHHVDFPIHTPYQDLDQEQRHLLWEGNEYFHGIWAFFSELEEKSYKIQNRVMLARYRGRTTCTVCQGGRLRKEATYVKIGGKNITELVKIPVDELKVFFEELTLTDYDQQVAKRLLLEISNRLDFMLRVGLGYLHLDRISSSLSGGETQRINLTRTLGSNLTASLYILDEPSIGLHPRDTAQLVTVLKSLRDLGNTVLVVEHEEEVIRNADFLVDVGPGAGIHGGKIVFSGPFEEAIQLSNKTLTTQYLRGERLIQTPDERRPFRKKIQIKGARQHNLKNIDVTIPHRNLTVVTGVSGSGKTTLVKQILHPAMMRHIGKVTTKSPGTFRSLEGHIAEISQIEMVNQRPIGKSSRSNPATYVKAYDAIRQLMSNQQLSKIRGFKPKHFSFNVEGGRCDACNGEGEQVIEMQFLADVRLECDSCQGKRFKQEVLDVQYKGKNIYDILNLSIEEALGFFDDRNDIIQKIQPLADVGLGYIKLGQSSSTLSGGEAQRVKLASFLGRENEKEHILFIFDEPTTGLHFHDIGNLLKALNGLVEKGHTVVVVEHNLEIIKSADWVIDLGPEGGKEGGHLVFEGRPDDLVDIPTSYTGQFLKEKLAMEQELSSNVNH